MKCNDQILSKVLLEIYAPVSAEELPSVFLRAIKELLPASTYVINIMNLQTGRWSNHGLGDFEALWARVEPAWQTLHVEHPTLKELTKGGPETVLKISDFVGSRRFQESGLYREVLEPFGGRDQIGLGLPVPGFHGGIAVNRDRAFTEEERRFVAFLRPHLIQAWRNAQMRDSLLAQLRSGRGMLSIEVDTRGNTGYLRKPVSSLLRRFFFSATPPSVKRLPEALRNWVRQALDRVDFFSTSWNPPLEVRRRGGLLRCHLQLHAGIGKHLLIFEEHSEKPAILTSLPGGCSLSSAEMAVLHHMVAGKRNKEIAECCGRSLRTIEKHVQHIFEKLGVSSRTEAVSKAFAGHEPAFFSG